MTKEREATCLASWSVVSISVGWQRERRGCVSVRFMWSVIRGTENQFGACLDRQLTVN